MDQRICSIDGCGPAKRLTRGMCEKHYRAWRRANERAGATVPDGRRRPVAECLAADCVERSTAKGMCRKHYLRVRRTGSLETLQPIQTLKSKCSVLECLRLADGARGWCNPHYQQWTRTGQDPVGTVAPQRPRSACEIDGCEKNVLARGWCTKHYKRWKRHGDPLARVRGEVVDGCRLCALCGADIPVRELRGSYCAACEPVIQARYLAANPRPLDTDHWLAECDVCGSLFQANARRKYACSAECTRRRNNRENWRHVQRRRAALRSAEAEMFSPREIYARDKWICGICGDLIDRTRRAPDPASPSIDHIVPLVLGGPHTRANTQAAHLGCNSRKGGRLTA